jgi:hypothetical protein
MNKDSPFLAPALAAIVSLVACASATGSNHAGDAGTDDAATASPFSPQAEAGARDAATSDASTACATEVPCAADVDCVARAGTRCNRALPQPRCQVLQCGAAGAPCSDSALCAVGLRCIDPTAFGVSAELRSGKCTTIDDARSACLATCLTTPPPNPSAKCTAAQTSRICQHVCDRSPDGWEKECVDYAAKFRQVACVGPTSCQLDLDCGSFVSMPLTPCP